MIIGSILLVLVAAALLAGGVYRDSGPLYYSSIATSILAAFALVVGLRRVGPRFAVDDDFDLGRDADGAPPAEPAAAVVSTTTDVPADEPAEQPVGAADAVALARLRTLVGVVDGRPRYHLPDCLHLLGRQAQLLPVNEAIEAQFTACAQCRPASRLLAGPVRGDGSMEHVPGHGPRPRHTTDA